MLKIANAFSTYIPWRLQAFGGKSSWMKSRLKVRRVFQTWIFVLGSFKWIRILRGMFLCGFVLLGQIDPFHDSNHSKFWIQHVGLLNANHAYFILFQTYHADRGCHCICSQRRFELARIQIYWHHILHDRRLSRHHSYASLLPRRRRVAAMNDIKDSVDSAVASCHQLLAPTTLAVMWWACSC